MRHRNIIITLSAGLAFLISCDKEPAVGTTLYPEKDIYGNVEAYIDNRCFFPKNEISTKLIQAGIGGSLKSGMEKVSIKVELTNPATQDLDFTLEVDDAHFKDEEMPATVLDAYAINFIRNRVTVKAGSRASEEAFEFMLDTENSQMLKDFTDEAIITLRLKSSQNVQTIEGYDTYIWRVSKEVTNIDADGSLEGRTEIDVSSYIVKAGFYGSVTDALSDSDTDTFSYGAIGATVKVEFNEEVDIIGLSISPMFYFGEWGMSCSKIDIYGGLSPDSLTRIGESVNPLEMPVDFTPWGTTFYSPVKVKFLTIYLQANYGMGTNIGLTELRFYK